MPFSLKLNKPLPRRNADDSIDIFTNIGRNKVVQARNAWTAAHGCANNSGCAGMVAILLISTLASIYSIYSMFA